MTEQIDEKKETLGNRFKSHVKRHKGWYIAGGVIVVGGTCFIVGKKWGRMEQQIKHLKDQLLEERSKQTASVDNSNTIIGNDNTITQNITQQIEQLSRPGNAGDMVYCPETDIVYPSKTQAEIELGLSKGTASKLTTGKKESAKGYRLIQVADWNDDIPNVDTEAVTELAG